MYDYEVVGLSLLACLFVPVSVLMLCMMWLMFG